MEKKIEPVSMGHEKLKQASAGFGSGMDGFRRLSADLYRDLPPLTQDRMIEISFYLWKSNALAHWLIETDKDFILGNGVTVTADDPEKDAELQDLLNEFWYDPVNNFQLWQEDQVRELAIYGEQCWPVFVNQHTGLVRLSSIDPALIKGVISDPDNARIAIGIELKANRGKKSRKFRIIYDSEDADMFTQSTVALRKTFSDGDCFFLTVNKVSTATRGTSDLLHLTDWIDAYDQFLFDFVERSDQLGSFIWDILLENADEAAITKFLSENPPPKKGSVRAHNEKVTWNAVTPDFKSADTGEGARILRNHILGGAGMPEHYFGGGGDVNRATSESMGAPTFKRLLSRQNRYKYILENVIDYQIGQALKVGRLKGIENPYAYTVNFPEMVTKDYATIAGTLASLTSALSIAESTDLIDKQTARKIFSVPSSLIGIDIDLTDMDQKVAEEEEQKAGVDYFGKTQALKAAVKKHGRKV